jgi:hypothetical protein
MRSSRNRLRYEESRKLGSQPCQGKKTFSSPRLPDSLTRTEALSPAVQRPKRGTDHSALSTAKVINKWSYVSTPPSFLMAYTRTIIWTCKNIEIYHRPMSKGYAGVTFLTSLKSGKLCQQSVTVILALKLRKSEGTSVGIVTSSITEV